jgi:hypothetical protein
MYAAIYLTNLHKFQEDQHIKTHSWAVHKQSRARVSFNDDIKMVEIRSTKILVTGNNEV